jgi:uncharacterized protein (DUF2249 family)
MNPSSTAHTLDVRRLDADARQAALLTAFNALRPGESLELLSRDEPLDLLERLQGEQKGRFDWWPHGHDAGRWEVEVTRRDAPLGALRHVAEALEWEHHRLAALAQEAFAARDAGRHDRAAALFAIFRRGLIRHIRIEEDLLFPAFEIRAGLPPAGPTGVMREEHREIRLLLEELGLALGAGRERSLTLQRSLERLLVEHNRKEEAVLYPALDALLTDSEGDTLVARFQALRA